MPRATKNGLTRAVKIPKKKNAAGPRNSIVSNLLFVKFQGLGCKGASPPASTPAIVRRAAEWEGNGPRNQTQKRKGTKNRRRQENNGLVDVPDAVCCAPPGIGIASDFAIRPKSVAPRSDHRKHTREVRRNEADFQAFVSSDRGPRTTRSVGEIIEVLMSQQPMSSGGVLPEHDGHHDWRLSIDDMSYEELVELSDRIGYVGSRLQEEEILSCLCRFSPTSICLLMNGHKDFKCSICQDKYKRSDDISTLSCGHHYHTHCIKQWLLFKNACPICKAAAFCKSPAMAPEFD